MANHVGVYSISATVLESPATLHAGDALTPSSVWSALHTTDYIQGTQIAEFPTREVQIVSGTEVVNLNTYFSGNEWLDDHVQRPVYMSKEQRFNYFMHKHVTTLIDVMNNMPETSPSGSLHLTSLPSFTHQDNASFFLVSLPTSPSASAVATAVVGNIVKIISGTSNYLVSTFSGSAVGNDCTVYFNNIMLDGVLLPGSTLSGVQGNAYLFSSIPISSSVSGVYMNNSIYNPSYVEIPVSESGRIRDARVWVEFIHDYREASQTSSNPSWGLQGIQIALRSPNTNFKSAHPLWNDESVTNLPLRTNTGLTGTNGVFGNDYYEIPETLRNSYLLWAGHKVDQGLEDSLSPSTVSSSYHEFDKDIDMRTVFWDGAVVNNPRDLSSLFPSASKDTPGSSSGFELFTSSLRTNYQSPTLGASGSGYTVTLSLTCSDIPWMVDGRISTGGLPNVPSLQATASVPPNGWLTGREPFITNNSWASGSISSGTLTNLFSGARLATSPLKNLLFIIGGENESGADGVSSKVGRVAYTQDNQHQEVILDTLSLATPSDLPFSRSRMGVASYTINGVDYIISAGGATSVGDLVGSTGVFVGTISNNDVSWSLGTALPEPHVDCVTLVNERTVYIVGGYSDGTPTLIIKRATLDDNGMPGLWSDNTHQLPGPSHCAFIISRQAQQFNATLITCHPSLADDRMISIMNIEPGGNIQNSNPVSGSFGSPVTDNFFPLIYNSSHIFAVGNANETGTFAANIYTDDPPSIGSWDRIGQQVDTLGTASIGSAISMNGMLFVGGASFSGVDPNFTAKKIFATNGIIQTAASDEFTTQGLQLGPSSIRPVYPLMDDIYSYKVVDKTPDFGARLLPTSHGVLRGFRPGLRNTESRGVWKVMFGTTTNNFNTNTGYSAASASGIWCRQVRLEFIMDVSSSNYEFFPSRNRKWTKPYLVPAAEGYQKISIESGSTAWDIGLNYTQVYQQPDYGRTVGITSDTTTSPDSFAVQTFITGALYTHLSSSGVFEPTWFLNGNGFGTPYIPDSSMSLNITGTAEQIDVSASQDIYRQTIGQTTLIPSANTMADLLARENYAQTTAETWEIVNSAAAKTSSGYFPF